MYFSFGQIIPGAWEVSNGKITVEKHKRSILLHQGNNLFLIVLPMKFQSEYMLYLHLMSIFFWIHCFRNMGKTISNQGNIAFLTILDDALYEIDQPYN
jgi:hypothetical protein